MRALLAAVLLAACAHPAPRAVPQPAGPAREELSRVVVRVAPETVVNDPVLADRGAQLRAALGRRASRTSSTRSSGYLDPAEAGRTAVFDASRSASITASRSAPSSR